MQLTTCRIVLAAVPKLDDFRFHDCRHHFASWFVMGGGLLQALKERSATPT